MKNLEHLSKTGVARITEVDKPYGYLHNMSLHPVEFRGMTFMTAATLFEWMRFEGHPEVQKQIKKAISPLNAITIAHTHRGLLKRGSKWDMWPEDIPLMKSVLSLKFTQHPELAKELVEIEPFNTTIILESAKSELESKNFWGAYLKKDGYGSEVWIGKNIFGTLLMELSSFLSFQTMHLNKWINSNTITTN